MLATYFTATTGINEISDPVMLNYNEDTGVAELSEGVNVDISNSGRLSRRKGQRLIAAGDYNTVYCNKGDCFAVRNRTNDSAIFLVNTDLSLTGIKSGLSKGTRISFCQVGDRTYYSSLFNNGVILAGIDYLWPILEPHVGPEVGKVFSEAPLGQHIEFHKGCMWIAQENVIWVSEPGAVNKFRKAGRYFQFGSNIVMLRAVKNGMWVSTGKRTLFIRTGDKLAEAEIILDHPVPAHEWSDCPNLLDLSNTQLNLSGENAIWSSNEGLCVGTPNGEMHVVTKLKLSYPDGSYGATVADGYVIYNNVF